MYEYETVKVEVDLTNIDGLAQHIDKETGRRPNARLVQQQSIVSAASHGHGSCTRYILLTFETKIED